WDDNDDDEEDDDDDDKETPVTQAKRKAETKKEKGTPPAKKVKTDGEGFSLYLGNLNHNKDFDEIKSAIAKFFSKEGLEIQDVRIGGTKKFGYVDFASEEEQQKALGLNGKKLMGQPRNRLPRVQVGGNRQEGNGGGARVRCSGPVYHHRLHRRKESEGWQSCCKQSTGCKQPSVHCE
uniref:RRM domain-containing protein n=1 Tax=Sinocyclocheilus grahami TaxID=75366 RepID=A0A672S8L2_SINGR